MANGPTPLAALCALTLSLTLAFTACSSEHAPEAASAAGAPADGGERSNASAGVASLGGNAVSAGGAVMAGSNASPPSAGSPSAGDGGGPPPAVDGHSVYTLECHGDSKDCNLATVPCFGVASQTPNVAAGWACSNRCTEDADCSDAPSGAEARASCVPFTSASHCVLVCQSESQTFACPDGMGCYVPPKSPVGYCLWP